jgi:apolipoprotein D and lipocalin family protein
MEIRLYRLMTNRLLFTLSLFTVALHAGVLASGAWGSEADDELPVTPVREVNLERYVGVWYEIAKIPNRFQKHCVRGTTAEYTLREDGRISVVNQCFTKDGSLDDAKGIAKVIDTTSNAKLKVSFVSFLGWRPFWGDYWVIGIDKGYEWAIVGTPDRKYGWILARTPTLDETTMEEIFLVIEQNGYERDAFQMSPQ